MHMSHSHTSGFTWLPYCCFGRSLHNGQLVYTLAGWQKTPLFAFGNVSITFFGNSGCCCVVWCSLTAHISLSLALALSRSRALSRALSLALALALSLSRSLALCPKPFHCSGAENKSLGTPQKYKLVGKIMIIESRNESLQCMDYGPHFI
jgi:hypothetical protein